MQSNSRIAKLSLLALGLGIAIVSSQAQASGFQLRETSVKNLGRGQAGVALSQGDASVVTNNPAAMAFIDKNTVQADFTVIDLTASFTGSAHTRPLPGAPNGLPIGGGNGGDPGHATVIPNMSAVFPMSGALDNLTFGVAIGAPFGLKTEYDSNWVGRYNAVTSDLKTIDLTLSAALQIHPRFSVGAGLIYERAEVTLSNTVDYGLLMAMTNIPGAVPANPATDGLASISGTSNDFGWILGAQWNATDRLHLGFSHRSSISHDIRGDAVFNAPASFQGLQPMYRVQAANAALPAATRALLAGLGNGFVPTTGTAKLTTPSVTTVSVQYDFSPAFRMMMDYQRTGWHVMKAVDIKFANPYQSPSHEAFDWSDSDMYALGAEFDLSNAITLRGGIARDVTPTNNVTRTPRLPDNNRTMYSIGATWHVSDALSVDAAYQRISISTPTINATTSLGTQLSGAYSGHANLFGVAAQYKF